MLVVAHMPVTVAGNSKNYLNKLSLGKTHQLSDFHWLKDNREYKTFVSNRVYKIKRITFIKWRQIPTKGNPTNLGSAVCGTCEVDNK